MGTTARRLELATRLALFTALGATSACAHGGASTAASGDTSQSAGSVSSAAEGPYVPPRIAADVVEARIVELRDGLSLDAAQEAQVRAILADACSRYELLRRRAEAAGGVDDPALRAQFVQLDFGTEDRIAAVLRCDQKDRLRVLERQARMARVEHYHAMRRREGEPPAEPPLLPSP